MFSLGPKSYFAFDESDGSIKRSSKGVQRRYKLTYDDYKNVLYRNSVVKATNVSIRNFRGVMSTIKQRKTGLSNKFIKAYVHDDRITVSPFTKLK